MLRERNGGEGLAPGFLEVPQIIYCDDPHWIPESAEHVEASLSAGSPWLRQGRAHTFCVPGRARASVFRPDGFELDGAAAAFFGHWESIGDRQADVAVLDAARAWAAEAGADRLYGPVNLSPAVAHCLRIDTRPDAGPCVGEPYNPPYYAENLVALGFERHRHYLSPEPGEDELRGLVARGAADVTQLHAEGYRLDALTPQAWADRREELRELVNVTFAGNFGFTPLTRAEFDAHFGPAWAARLDPELSVLAVAPTGELAGFGLMFPDYAPLVAQGAGAARIDVDALRYDEHARLLSGRSAVSGAGGVTPQHQRLGIVRAMASEVALRALERGVVRIVFARSYSKNPVLRVFSHVRGRRGFGLYITDTAARCA
jgi:GNAT superfamily N-acetyltransferase